MYTFTKKERLCNRETIQQLYNSPHKLLVFPLSVHWLSVDYSEQKSRLQTVIVAPKKKLHHAVDRNRTKRLMKECFRVRKGEILKYLEEHNISIALSINYINNTLPEYHRLGTIFDKLTELLCKQIDEYLHHQEDNDRAC